MQEEARDTLSDVMDHLQSGLRAWIVDHEHEVATASLRAQVQQLLLSKLARLDQEQRFPYPIPAVEVRDTGKYEWEVVFLLDGMDEAVQAFWRGVLAQEPDHG